MAGPDFTVASLCFSLFGAVGSIVIAAIYVLCPRFRQHPTEIILTIAITDFFMALRILIRSVAWQVYPYAWPQARSMHLFKDGCLSDVICATFFESASQAWNAVWCLNLILRIKFPTMDTRRFLPFFHAYAWLSAAGLTAMEAASRTYGEIHFGDYVYCGEKNYSLSNPIVAVEFAFTLVQLGVSVASLFILYQRLGNVLDNKESRVTLRLHFAYVIIFFTLWLFQRLASVVSSDNSLHQISALFWIAQAFFVAIVRLCEPGVLPTLLLALHVPARVVAVSWPSAAAAAAPRSSRSAAAAAAAVPLLENHTDPLADSGVVGSLQASWGISDRLRVELEVSDSFGPHSPRKPAGSGRGFKSPTARPQQPGMMATDAQFVLQNSTNDAEFYGDT